MWVDTQIPLIRQYLTPSGSRHWLLSEAALLTGSVTLNRDFLKTVRFKKVTQINNNRSTVFKEIKVPFPEMTNTVSFLTNLASSSNAYTQNSLSWTVRRPIIEILTKIFERDWDSDDFHLMFHSSGYDSRIISQVLARMRDKFGEGWLGDVLFLCWGFEGALFKKIMEFQGWKEDNYHVYNEGVGIDYRAELIDFDRVWRWCNPYCLPWCPAGPALEDAMQRGLIPKKRSLKILGGMYANELVSINYTLERQGVSIGKLYPNKQVGILINKYYFKEDMSATCSIIASYGEYKLPFVDIGIAPSLSNNFKLCMRISPKLAKLPCFSHVRKDYEDHIWLGAADKRLSRAVRKEAAMRFNDSWFAKTLEKPEIDLSPSFEGNYIWWRDYVLASTCEWLIDQGVDVSPA